MNTEFTIMHKDEKITEVSILDGVVSIKKYSNGIWQPFHKDTPSIRDVYKFLKSRCYENGRHDLKEILSLAGMESNNPWEWVKRTHGVMFEDKLWIRFKEETLTWKDVKIR